jgi:FAD synthase
MIWGYWDGWHAGMQASMEHALRVCNGATLHVVIIDGNSEIDTNHEVLRSDLVLRRNEVKKKVNEIKKQMGVAVKVVYHEYATLAESLTHGGDFDFDVVFLTAKEVFHCDPYDTNLSTMQGSRTSNGLVSADVEIVPLVYEEGTSFVCSSTKIRKRKKREEQKNNKLAEGSAQK